MKEGILERLLFLCNKETGGNVSAFSKLIGVNQKTLSQQLNKECSVSLSVLLPVLSSLPDVSSEWLLRGKGEMILSDNLPPILGDDSENDLNAHAMLVNLRKEIDKLNIEIASLKEEIWKKEGVIEWQKDFISEIMEEKNELEKQIPQQQKKEDIV